MSILILPYDCPGSYGRTFGIPSPADVIATGTPAGVAKATGSYLQPGDRIECTIEKLGTLKNTLSPQPEKFYEPLCN